MTKDGVNIAMIVLAREARGLAQNELAERIGMSATNLSKIERGDIGISDGSVEAIADATGYPPHFFHQQGIPVPENFTFRKRHHVAQKLLTPIHAQANIHRRHVQFFTRALSIAAPNLPDLARCTPAEAATQLRKLWGITNPVIDNLTRLLEAQGIPVVPFNFGTDRVDSRSMHTDDDYPVIFINNALLGDKLRFSLAYELGGLVMHAGSELSPDHDLSHEANAFAAEWLMPAEHIRKDFEGGITLPILGSLKKKWKVSMISLLYRADDLGFLSPNQKRYLLQQFNAAGIRRREPVELDVPVEKPSLMKQWITSYRAKTGLGTLELATILCLHVDEFIELYS
ncbi:XRE family transcriptional regulator [Chitinophagaceae bacterium LB-8]|uniref:XRE family transcriptional regulator n=1 Tax=Paraflavisolibacter caeni TaxID=2982496 RepID=A0A9X2XY76_9BACT|nr:XRE family transcriptional regulator [Paraflavisolibacter caeni]MCU7551606.1 XRE family transcriptional regulator [Paraflavisolibacter caeni]